MITNKIKSIIQKYDWVLGVYRYRLREILFSKRPGIIEKNEIPFRGFETSLEILPNIDSIILNSGLCNNFSYNGCFIDIIDFKNRIITRYKFSTPYLSRVFRLSKKLNQYKNKSLWLPESVFHLFFRIPHTSHMSPEGYICSTNLYTLMILDTKKNKIFFFPKKQKDDLILFSRTGCFSSDYKSFYFVKWNWSQLLKVRNREKDTVKAEICRIQLDDKKIEMLYELEVPENIHRVVCTRDDKYLIICSMTVEVTHLISTEKYNASEDIAKHKSLALDLSKVITYDITNKTHWETKIPFPTPAHIELDLDIDNVFYVAAHNMFNHRKKGFILGGSGAIVKMRIEDNKTSIISFYSDDSSFRLTQHCLFKYKNRSYLVMTTNPYGFRIIDTEDMKLWRKINIGPNPPYLLKDDYVKIEGLPLNVNASNDGSYIIASNTDEFYVYDVDKHKVLDVRLYLPKGRGPGHTRTFGM